MCIRDRQDAGPADGTQADCLRAQFHRHERKAGRVHPHAVKDVYKRQVYHMVDTETKEISQTDILRPLAQTFGIGRYYDDVNPEFMDAFEVALLVRQAEEQATACLLYTSRCV